MREDESDFPRSAFGDGQARHGALNLTTVFTNPHPNPSPSRPGSWFGWPCNGGAEVSKAPVRSHTLWQPDRPGTLRPVVRMET